ncbi:MAG: DUF1816 domain-containing protein [Cyanobacteria bacterium]|nr:DUF1816 domain-containing protein [Cyanobacteriota bacterium]MEB3269571.1 DUF1816 domain-containing protein [Leptolyngbya sp.]
MKNLFSRIFGSVIGSNKAWWVEIKTEAPTCTYYFGPFDIAQEAELAKQGYIEDLEQENAQNIQATVMQCSQPNPLTVFDYSREATAPVGMPAFSGQS